MLATRADDHASIRKTGRNQSPTQVRAGEEGDGLIVSTIHPYDPNLTSVSVTAMGNSGLSVPMVDTPSVPLSKKYNGNPAEQGYPVPTEFIWDPWSDPAIIPCC